MKRTILFFTALCFCFIFFSNVDAQQRRRRQRPQQRASQPQKGTEQPAGQKEVSPKERTDEIQNEKLLEPVLDISNSPLAEITKRELSSNFVLEYSNVRKYFGDNLDPISVLENPIYLPWWILRTKGAIHRLGFRSFTKNGALIGGSIAQTFVKEGYTFVAIRGAEAYLALAHQEDIVDCLGVNTEVQFDSANWVPFSGKEFRNGGFPNLQERSRIQKWNSSTNTKCGKSASI